MAISDQDQATQPRSWLRRNASAPFALKEPGRVARLGRWLRFRLSESLWGTDAPCWDNAKPSSWRSRALLGAGWAISLPVRLLGLGIYGLLAGLFDIALRLVQPFGRERLLHFVAGIPALATLAAAITLALWIQTSKDQLLPLYQEAATAAMEAEDYAAAEVYWQRMIDDRQDPEARFNLSQVLEKTGREAKAVELMRALAPPNRKGYPGAHRALALRMAASLNQDAPQEQLDETRWHLDQAGENESPEINYAWAQYYLMSRQVDKSIAHLENAAKHWPEMHHVLGEVYYQLQRPAQARAEYNSAYNHYRTRLQEDPLDHLARADMASILMRLDLKQNAVDLLQQGIALDDRAPLKALLATALMQLFDQEKNKDAPDYAQLLKLLQAAFHCDPGNQLALERLTGMGRDATSEGRQRLRRLLSDAMASGQTPAMGHFALGILAFQDRDLANARWHLEQAHRLNDQLPLVQNNLAWLLANAQPPDLQRALNLAEKALASLPDDPRLLDTLGFIQAQRGELDAAVTAYERALLRASPKSAENIHCHLAEVYEQLEQAALAEAHRRQSARN